MLIGESKERTPPFDLLDMRRIAGPTLPSIISGNDQ